jgi:hypothetical protein
VLNPGHSEGGNVLINNDFEIGYLLIIFALLGIILLGTLLSALHLDRWHPRLLGAAIGALLGIALIEAVPLIT